MATRETELLIQRLEGLIDRGQAVVGTIRRGNGGESMDYAAFHGWKASALAFLDGTLGPGDTYSAQAREAMDNAYSTSASRNGLAILEALKADVERGYLGRLEQRVVVDVIGDFVGMALELLDQGHKDPSAMVLGAVLEESLRRLASLHAVEVPTPSNLDTLNNLLLKAGAYNKVQHGAITSWRTVRNEAAHGNFAAYTADDVRRMLSGVQQFLLTHLPT